MCTQYSDPFHLALVVTHLLGFVSELPSQAPEAYHGKFRAEKCQCQGLKQTGVDTAVSGCLWLFIGAVQGSCGGIQL